MGNIVSFLLLKFEAKLEIDHSYNTVSFQLLLIDSTVNHFDFTRVFIKNEGEMSIITETSIKFDMRIKLS